MAIADRQVGPTGRVVGIDHIDGLVQESVANLAKHQQALLDRGQIKMVVGDGRRGYTPGAPYDCIHVGAAFGHLPEDVLQQLKIGGVFVAPVGTLDQFLVAIKRESDTAFSRVRGRLVWQPVLIAVLLTREAGACVHRKRSWASVTYP